MMVGTAGTSGSVVTVVANSKMSVCAIRGCSRSHKCSVSPSRSGRVPLPPLPVMVGAGASTRGAGVQRRSLAVAGMDLAVSQARRGADAEEDEDDGTMSFLEMERQESGEEREVEQGRERAQKRESGRGASRKANVEAETGSDRGACLGFSTEPDGCRLRGLPCRCGSSGQLSSALSASIAISICPSQSPRHLLFDWI